MHQKSYTTFKFNGYPTDRDLVLALSSDDDTTRNHAFNVLLDTLQQPIYFHLRRLLGNHEDAADAAQTTFIKVHNSLHTFAFKSKLSSWIFTISTRQGLDLIRKRRTTEVDFETHLANIQSDIYFNGNEATEKIHAAVLSLPEKQRVVFILKYFEGLDYKSISDATNTSVGSLKASYHHAKQKIKPFLLFNVI
jgi:RNA polymerase sigma-70 factor (ECF subfamily)